MPELNYLKFQPIDSSSDDTTAGSQQKDEDIVLDEQIDEHSLESYWDDVVRDIHEDPDWFTFADE
jgi:hypothetical protein